jgi:hypothetical protein
VLFSCQLIYCFIANQVFVTEAMCIHVITSPPQDGRLLLLREVTSPWKSDLTAGIIGVFADLISDVIFTNLHDNKQITLSLLYNKRP